jgi:hypothetical protein
MNATNENNAWPCDSGNANRTGPFMTEALLRSEASVDFLHCLIGFFDLKRRTKTRPTIPTYRAMTTHIPTFVSSFYISSSNHCWIFSSFSREITWDGSAVAG